MKDRARQIARLHAALVVCDFKGWVCAEQDAGERGCIGVTTGQLLCACVGSRVRAEYTVFGDAINLAARLMVTAARGGQAVLCDFRTRELACAAGSYIALEPMAVKVRRSSPTPLLPPLQSGCMHDMYAHLRSCSLC